MDFYTIWYECCKHATLHLLFFDRYRFMQESSVDWSMTLVKNNCRKRRNVSKGWLLVTASTNSLMISNSVRTANTKTFCLFELYLNITYKGRSFCVKFIVNQDLHIFAKNVGGHLVFLKSHVGGQRPPGLNLKHTPISIEKCEKISVGRPNKLLLKYYRLVHIETTFWS